MPDREKVIQALEVCCSPEDVNPCELCPYFLDGKCQSTMKEDAPALLKEQEPVSVVEEWAWYDCYKCGACDKLWGKKYEIERWNFCPWCGRKVKWNA